MATFEFWYYNNGLKKETVEILDSSEALVLVTESDLANLDMTLG